MNTTLPKHRIELRQPAALNLVASTAAAAANVLVPGVAWIGFAWIATAVAVFCQHFRKENSGHASVLVFWLGALPSALALSVVNMSSYNVSDLGLQLAWVALKTYLLLTIWYARPIARRDLSSPPREDLRLLAVASSALTLATGAAFFASAGFPLLQQNAEQARVAASTGNAVALTIIHTSALVAVVASILTRGNSTSLRLWQLAIMWSVPAVVLLTGSRGVVLKILVGAIFAAFYVSRWSNLWLRLFPLAGAAALGAALVGQLRYAGGSSSLTQMAVQRLAADPFAVDVIMSSTSNDWRLSGLGPFMAALGTYAPGEQPLLGEILKQQSGLDFAGGALAVPLAAKRWMVGEFLGVMLLAWIMAVLPAAAEARFGRTHYSRLCIICFSANLGRQLWHWNRHDLRDVLSAARRSPSGTFFLARGQHVDQ